MSEALLARIVSHTAHISVIGQGYVGLPLAVEFARAGFTVTGIDNDPDRVASLGSGRSHVPDVPSEDVQNLLRAGHYRASSDSAVLGDSDVIVICVPTPLRKSKDPDISYVVAAVEAAAARFRLGRCVERGCADDEQRRGWAERGQLIVLESTTYPGSTEELVVPMFEARGATVGRNLFVAFSPERIDPGNPLFKVGDIPKVVGGVTPTCTVLASALYRQIVQRVHAVSSPKAAELAKLYENVFRNVNIALANEFALMCRRLGVDTREVIDAAATKPFGFMPFYPGPGLGGHCIPVDPLYLSWKMRANGFESRFIALADDVNRAMPRHVLDLVIETLNDGGLAVKGARLLVLGVAYKRGVGDTRESPAHEIIAELQRMGADVTYADPYVPTFGDLKAAEPTEQALREADGVVIVTDHPEFDYAAIARHARRLVDTRQRVPIPPGGRPGWARL